MVQARKLPFNFMFCTGIENSIPTIDGGKVRFDQLESCHHYERWKEDFRLVAELGIRFLRYGPALHKTFIAPGKYDWEFSDQAFAELQARSIVPIVDLCHFGVPDWIKDFQNNDFPRYFAEYARAFAQHFPWIQLYTPVNEMFICAQFSALYGWWNEQQQSDRAFVRALNNIVKANVLAMHEILAVRPDALFVQSESTEYFHAANPRAIKDAEIRNEQRFLSLDLNYGKRVSSEMYEYLLDNGMTREEYHFFLNNDLRYQCILGNDYYYTNEHRVEEGGRSSSAGEVFGYNVIKQQYYHRYELPVMHTETNIAQEGDGSNSIFWLWREWANVLRLRNDMIPIVGFTWYSLIDQTDWDIALRQKRDKPHPVGLFDMERNIRPVGAAYKKLISDWEEILPTRSVCLQIPLDLPEESQGLFSHAERIHPRRGEGHAVLQ